MTPSRYLWSCLLAVAVAYPLGDHAQAQVPNTLNQGLVAYYPFNGDARDASGQDFDGLIQGATFGLDRFGFNLRAGVLNGINDHIDLGGSPAFNPGTSDFTLSAWIRPAGPAAGTYFLGKFAGGGSHGYGLGLTPNGTAYAFLVAEQPYVDLSGGPSLLDGKWHQVTAVFRRNSLLSLYVDAALAGQVSIVSENGPLTNSLPLLIGKLSSGQAFPGGVDDVRVYNRTLTDSEISALYALDSRPAGNHPALATPVVVNGFMVGVNLQLNGLGYTSAPVVQIIGTGTGAKATAKVKNGSVTEITVDSPGSGYGTNTVAQIDPPPRSIRRATGISGIANGQVAFAVVGDSGFGYTTPPAVNLVGGGGTGATAVARIADGVLLGITLTAAGSGYTSAPTVVIESPSFQETVDIKLTQVRVTQSVVLGQKYQLEASSDLNTWSALGPRFVADVSLVALDVEVEASGRYFRLRRLP